MLNAKFTGGYEGYGVEYGTVGVSGQMLCFFISCLLSEYPAIRYCWTDTAHSSQRLYQLSLVHQYAYEYILQLQLLHQITCRYSAVRAAGLLQQFRQGNTFSL